MSIKVPARPVDQVENDHAHHTQHKKRGEVGGGKRKRHEVIER